MPSHNCSPRALDLLAKSAPSKPRKARAPQVVRVPGIGKCRVTARNGEWLHLAAPDGEPFVRHVSELN